MPTNNGEGITMVKLSRLWLAFIWPHSHSNGPQSHRENHRDRQKKEDKKIIQKSTNSSDSTVTLYSTFPAPHWGHRRLSSSTSTATKLATRQTDRCRPRFDLVQNPFPLHLYISITHPTSAQRKQCCPIVCANGPWPAWLTWLELLPLSQTMGKSIQSPKCQRPCLLADNQRSAAASSQRRLLVATMATHTTKSRAQSPSPSPKVPPRPCSTVPASPRPT